MIWGVVVQGVCVKLDFSRADLASFLKVDDRSVKSWVDGK